jgi:hypothetical protein
VTRKEKEENGLREGCDRLLNKRGYQKQKWKEITAVSKTGQFFFLKTKKPKKAKQKQEKWSCNWSTWEIGFFFCFFHSINLLMISPTPSSTTSPCHWKKNQKKKAKKVPRIATHLDDILCITITLAGKL